jgi:hypothetical protein
VAPTSEESPLQPLSKGEESHESAWSPGQESPAPALSKWLRLMLAEIIRKREEREQAHAEELRREVEEGARVHNRFDSGSGI